VMIAYKAEAVLLVTRECAAAAKAAGKAVSAASPRRGAGHGDARRG
jgi:hypothetical protein